MKQSIRTALLLLLAATPLCTVAQTTPFDSAAPPPCPEVLIGEKYDHVPLLRYRQQGWDTVVTCAQHEIVLTTEPFIPVQYFNGTYVVTEIPYNPPDPTFYINYTGVDTQTKKKMNITADDYFAPSAVTLNFPFYFFGIRKTKFRIGDNGIVTFSDTDGSYDAGNYTPANKCDWSCPVALPWTSSTADAPFSYGTNCMRDAIYGVYQDTHVLPSTVSGNQGIYYGLIGEWPCRKIIATWNEIPLFSSQTDKRQSYQIVCYEGTNIIEVHIKKRDCTPGTCEGRATIGIQNATGTAQVTGPNDTPNHYVVAGSPASFAPSGWNPKQCSDAGANVTNKAYRFTPQGNTPYTFLWYRLTAAGDSIPLSTTPGDPNGWYEPMNQYDPLHPRLTRAHVSPSEPTRYVAYLYFLNAEGEKYRLRDTIFVGVDTTDYLLLTANGGGHNSDSVLNVCQGATVNCPLNYTDIQTPERISWTIKRQLNGAMVDLGDGMLTFTPNDTAVTIAPDPNYDQLPENKIDSIWLHADVDFISGCSNFDSVLVRIFPNFDIVDTHYICQGDPFVWSANGQSYTTSNHTAVAELESQPGCDSIVHLALTVHPVYHIVDPVVSCKPYTWINDSTYYETNTETAYRDTIMLKTKYGDCDSIVQLDFTLKPVVARIKSSLSHFDFDNLDVVLNDVSLNNDTRRWLFPNGSEQVAATAYYSIPYTADSADITLMAHSPDGDCWDTTVLTLPFRKETFWMPNAFTPGNPAGNNKFGSTSNNTLSQEMYIYNRTGQLVFHCEGVDCQWDGRDLNGRDCPQGAYAYIIRYTNKFEPKVTKVIRGTVTLIR